MQTYLVFFEQGVCVCERGSFLGAAAAATAANERRTPFVRGLLPQLQNPGEHFDSPQKYSFPSGVGSLPQPV